jgi:carbamoyl-phosphate synthase large subunit
MSRHNVMIAGVGGASLGTELCKCLRLAGTYDVFGCDISPTAYGLYDSGFTRTIRVGAKTYVDDVLRACREVGANWLVPGGEQPTALLGAAKERLATEGVQVVVNDPSVVRLFSDKKLTFEKLAAAGIPIPRTAELLSESDLETVGLPCIVKPATGSGGSVSVFFAVTAEEAMIYGNFIRRTGGVPIAQEYVSDQEGEFTIGVLSVPGGRLMGSIALRRSLEAKLSVSYRGRGGVVSSGYSQGYIGPFPDICRQAESISKAAGSQGPLNIQGRVRNGVLVPFEINPRFSASSYLRAMAGFNELDIFLRHLIDGDTSVAPEILPGWYLRSLTETFVPAGGLKP